MSIALFRHCNNMYGLQTIDFISILAGVEELHTGRIPLGALCSVHPAGKDGGTFGTLAGR